MSCSPTVGKPWAATSCRSHIDQVVRARTGRKKPALRVLWANYLDEPAGPGAPYYSCERFCQIVVTDKTHRQHAVIEQVNADLKNSALAHMPSGKFAGNAAWLVCAVIAFNLTRAAGIIAGTGRHLTTQPRSSGAR